jgi:hypothetical protein
MLRLADNIAVLGAVLRDDTALSLSSYDIVAAAGSLWRPSAT